MPCGGCRPGLVERCRAEHSEGVSTRGPRPADDGDVPGERDAAGPLDSGLGALGAFRVPDDIAELDADIAAYHRELRAAARRARRVQLLSGPVQRGPLVVMGLAVLAALTTLLASLVPAFPHAQRAVPLAAPGVPTGQVGGLLPDVTVEREITASVRELARPAVLLLLPTGCGCAVDVQHAAQLLTGRKVPLLLVADAPETDEARKLAGGQDVGRGVPGVVVDRGQRVAAGLRALPDTVTMVYVRPDGLITDIIREVVPGTLFSLSAVDRAEGTDPSLGADTGAPAVGSPVAPDATALSTGQPTVPAVAPAVAPSASIVATRGPATAGAA